jgi:hypothetical protein
LDQNLQLRLLLRSKAVAAANAVSQLFLKKGNRRTVMPDQRTGCQSRDGAKFAAGLPMRRPDRRQANPAAARGD